MSSSGRHQVVLTEHARQDLLFCSVRFYRRWGTTLDIDWPSTLELIHEWVSEPLASNPYAHSERIANTSIHYWTQDKGPNFGTFTSGYIISDEEMTCRIVLIQANADFDIFLTTAIRRASRLGANYRDDPPD